jgi:hypothetical protein
VQGALVSFVLLEALQLINLDALLRIFFAELSGLTPPSSVQIYISSSEGVDLLATNYENSVFDREHQYSGATSDTALNHKPMTGL